MNTLEDRPPPRYATMPACVSAAELALRSCLATVSAGDVIAAEVALADSEEALDCACRVSSDLLPDARGGTEASSVRAALVQVGHLWEETQAAHTRARVVLRERQRAHRRAS